MRVAIVHDWLTGMRGGERILDIFCQIFPQAELFTLIYKKGALSPTIEKRPIHTSFVQHLPFVQENYRNYLPLFPLAVEAFDLKGFDLVISSSHCVAKGAKRPKGAFHFCYCYTPMRYVWTFFDQYFGSYPFWKRALIRMVSEDLKRWDLATLDRVDEFVAISKTIQERIKRIYNRESVVIYPPVELDKFTRRPSVAKEDCYLCVSALVPYKRIDVMVEAFNAMPDRKLVIVGDGNVRKELEKKRISSNIHFMGWVDHDAVVDIYHRAKAFIYAAEEDFGIAPVEAQAAGLPVIAYGKGGATETVIPLGSKNPTGLFFMSQDSLSLIEAVREFEKREKDFNPQDLVSNANRFTIEHFKTNIQSFVTQHMGKL